MKKKIGFKAIRFHTMHTTDAAVKGNRCAYASTWRREKIAVFMIRPLSDTNKL